LPVTVSRSTSVQKMEPPSTVLLVNETRRVGSGPLIPDSETAVLRVPWTMTLESMMTSVGAAWPVGSKSRQESVLGGVISM
jgi:hypothetical protein